MESYPNEEALVADVKKALEEGTAKAGRQPKVIVIGALGRCGSGAVAALRKAGVQEENILKWDMAETAKGGPFSTFKPLWVLVERDYADPETEEITDCDIFVNCIYLTSKIPNFGMFLLPPPPPCSSVIMQAILKVGDATHNSRAHVAACWFFNHGLVRHIRTTVLYSDAGKRGNPGRTGVLDDISAHHPDRPHPPEDASCFPGACSAVRSTA